MTFLPALLWVLPAAVWGAVAGWWTPRGPLTITQALCSVAVSVAIGWSAGRFGRSRLVWLVVPLSFLITLELARSGVPGPSTGPPHGSPFGVIALVAGRGLQLALTLLPLLLALAAGRGIRRRVLFTIPAAALLLFTAAVAVPARTAGIPSGVAELTRVGRLGVMIRGAHADAPVLLFVPGAPGGSELGNVRTHLGAVEQRFVMATLDRRGGGSSYPALDPASRVTVDRMVDDIIEVTDYLRQRFGQDKIYLYGHSGGSVLSVLAVQRHPEKFRAYIGSGQGVDLLASDRIFYDDILAWARSNGRDEVVRQMTALGPPPYPGVWGYEPIMTYEGEVYDQRPLEFGLGVREFTLLQKIHVLNAVLDTWDVLYPRMQDIDLRRDAPSLEVPAWFVMGGNEMRGLRVLFEDWYAQLRAPRKKLVIVPGAGHPVQFEQPDRFVEVLDDVLAG
ncbi:alpha/beta hydrolase [Actinoplanes sp. LDG1-06]|uniref:Alpha/beta hydrolase n=1 Tax=Paractinoplanes ovalisporus TaxID=2810368 RepID=A0ABS2A6V0_9ACTN|nr:alpha/beta hydrolase [Actinoplanes ovalisporus]MBM2615562.1 alpha/beta hydrolase [Actinoplanes ovalisporus]